MRNWSHYCVRGTWFVIISLVLADWARGPRYCIRHTQATIGHRRLGHFTTSHRLLDRLMTTDRDKRKMPNASCWLDNINLHWMGYMSEDAGLWCPMCCICMCTLPYIYAKKKKRRRHQRSIRGQFKTITFKSSSHFSMFYFYFSSNTTLSKWKTV